MRKRRGGGVGGVRGAGRGMGLASARRLAAEGASVVCADVDSGSGEKAAAEVDGLFVQADVTDERAVEALFAAAVATYGRLDIAFKNPGISPPDADRSL